LAGDDIDIASRVARASMDAALFGQLGGVDAARRALRQRAGILLDPTVVDAFCSDADDVMAEVDQHDPSDRLLVVEPDPYVEREPQQLNDVAAAFGDLADVKGPFLHGHSKTVARLATGAARRIGLGSDDVRRVELAGLLQDVGRVGVSNAVWERAGPLTRADLEQVRMHAYYSERVLAASPTLAPIARIAGLHHERLDGTGYHRGCEAGAIPIEARLLAVADAFAAMTRERPHRPALEAEEAGDAIAEEAGRGLFDHDAVVAVLAEAGEAVARPRPTLPAALTQREGEVLTLLAEGSANAQIAHALGISRRTAEHHVQHIYTKIGVSTRAGAALFAVEHDLVRRHR
jgi:response regulator RpfG family c-di-GMP phosphodiesterase/DNA-binding CsgD family transcriptional regulator